MFRIGNAVRWAIITLLTIFMGLIAVIFSLFSRGGGSFRFFSRIWARGCLRTWGITLQIPTPLTPGRPRVIMANHASLLDIPVMFLAIPDRIVFMAKQKLFKIPFLGWAMKTNGFIPVDRKDRSKATATFKSARKSIEKGFSIMIFPEETRSKDGSLLPFKKGGFLLSRVTGAAILPVGLHGTADIIDRKNRYYGPGTVRVLFGEEVVLEKKSEIDNLIAAVRGQIDNLAQKDWGQA